MLIKENPEDFLVEEILPEDFRTRSEDKYLIFSLTKTGIDTNKALLTISSKYKIPYAEIGYSGLKDKYAVTIQYFSVPYKYKLYLAEEMSGAPTDVTNKLQIRLAGYAATPIERNLHIANRFKVKATLTDDEIKNVEKNIESVGKLGFVNYYDTQRIGHLTLTKTFGYHFFKKDYKEAFARYYIHHMQFFGKNEKETMKEALKSWGDWKKVIEIIKKNKFLAKILNIKPIEHIEQNPDDFVGAINQIPSFELELLLNGFQSLLWNDLAKEMIAKYAKTTRNFKDFIFIDEIDEKEKKSIDIVINIPSATAVYDPLTEYFFRKVIERYSLAREALAVGNDFQIRENTGRRNLISKPSNLSFDKSRSEFSFQLPKGSYGTVLLKSLVC